MQFLGVAARLKKRMQQVSAGDGPHRRPILLFPEGTTTNGRYLLRFRTGTFIAGVPIQPTILKYGPVSVQSLIWVYLGVYLLSSIWMMPCKLAQTGFLPIWPRRACTVSVRACSMP